ncbi:MAG TPA: ABC-three component system protein [Microvirga sp.]|jgi:hypothetical protein|nr:ABC-three component system protein [Microvirga sp.]
MSSDFKDIGAPPTAGAALSADQAVAGPRIPPQQQILIYSAEEWEIFVQEWAHYCLKQEYIKVQRASGAGDKGIDVAGFVDAAMLQGIWDNYQCKHYGHALYPSDAWPEIGKILWYSFNGDYKPPRRYYFVAPRGVGTTFAGNLADKAKLKKLLIENWDKNCRTNITDTQEIALDGEFLKYVKEFDFSIFGAKTALEIIEDHRASPVHIARFGGGLPNRPNPDAPPDEITPPESNYVAHLLSAYADHTKKPVPDIATLKSWSKLNDHFGRQRVAFYHAESLRVFARDTVPEGTFESLQDEIHAGVVDVCDSNHCDGYERVCAVTKEARNLPITSNPLIARAKVQDREGICQQLANEDRLKWTKP